MEGCNFEKKSFSVIMSCDEKKEVCEECKKVIEGTLYRRNRKRVCKECWDKV